MSGEGTNLGGLGAAAHQPENTIQEFSAEDEAASRKGFIGAIDQGTTSTRFLIFDATGNPVASHQIEFTQMYPHSG